MTTDATLLSAALDLEGIFEKATASVFKDLEITAYTSQMVVSTGNAEQDAALEAQGYSIVAFQKPTPRAEIFFNLGAGQGREVQFNVFTIDGQPQYESVETCWAGSFQLDIITDPDVRIHRAFRTQIRAVMLTLPTRINWHYIKSHRLQHFIRDNGTSPLIKPEEGYMLSTLSFEGNISMQDGTWDTLLDA